VLLVFNGLAIALALSFFVILLWYNLKPLVNQFFALFLALLVLWNLGFFLGEVAKLVVAETLLQNAIQSITTLAFMSVPVGFYALTALLAGIQPRFFQPIVWLSLFTLASFNLLIVISQPEVLTLKSISVAPFFIYNSFSLYILWRYRRKIANGWYQAGGLLFVLGQGGLFVNETLNLQTLSIVLSSTGALLMSASFVRRELIAPLANRNKQLETMHEVSLAITSRIATNALLQEISERSVAWVGGDAAGIYLKQGQAYQLVASYELPERFAQKTVTSSHSVIWRTATTRQSLLSENYATWEDDVLFSSEVSTTFGSAISTPMVYTGDVIGVLLVIASRQGKLFQQEDVRLLELLASQAAVAIKHDIFISNQMELDRIKSEMVRMTSHDLKNPLQAATANLDLLKEDLVSLGIYDGEVRLSVRNIERQIDKMQRIIGGILDLERVRMGVNATDACLPEEIVRVALDEVADMANEKSITVSVHAFTQRLFVADRQQLERAFVNLLDNAIKFTPTGGAITVEIAEREADYLQFTVSDTGVGVPESIKDKIFERFYRGNQRGVESVRGSGLGLSLVKSVVESHQGKIWVESDNAQVGSRFIILLPIQHPNSLTQPPKELIRDEDI
jgi:signal transduction histidine kinase